MAKRQQKGSIQWSLLMTGCAWACALLTPVVAEAHADVDTSTGLGDNTLTNTGTYYIS